MTALEIALAGYLAFGQPTGNYYEAITKHSGLQVMHADGAVTLRLEETGREETAEGCAKTVTIRMIFFCYRAYKNDKRGYGKES